MDIDRATLSNVLNKYQISSEMASRLKKLQNYKIAVILDDSSSMNTVDSYEQKSRWNELLKISNIIVELGAVFNSNGSDVYFLNMASIKNVTSTKQLEIFLRDLPQGSTPLTRTIRTVINDNPDQNRKLLVIVVTDGEPTDTTGLLNIPEFKEVLLNRPNYVYINIVAVTNDKSVVGYLSGLDMELPRLDVIDDYQSELTEIIKIRGSSHSFTFGDYVSKTMLGSIDLDIDIIDEYKIIPKIKINVDKTALASILTKYQISAEMAERLQKLQNYKIVVILDDSSSMNIVDRADKKSRWDELYTFANIIIEVGSFFNPNGCDVYFLNMASIKNVRDTKQLEPYFRDKPQGATPLTPTIKSVINENPDNKNLLMIIATDGEPTDANSLPNIPEFKQILLNRPNYVFTNIIAVTNDQSVVGYLNGLDNELPRLDVIDDYQSVLASVKKTKGSNFSFTYGDYVTKAMLGSIDRDFDTVDEKKNETIYL